jgi:hypothetical protein
MHCSTARWTSTLAVAALIALPVASSAQTPPPAAPPTPQTTSAAQPSADPKPADAQAQPAQDAKIDAAAAKEHLSQARDTLSKLTSLPEAAKLEGDARTQVSQLISNFNELITTQADWRAAYAKVDANLMALLGPATSDPAPAPAATGVSGAVGTSGASAVQIDPAVRGKLVEFRTHLKGFERAAGGVAGATAPSVATDATANPANPTPANPATPTNPAGAASPANPPTPMITSSPTTRMAPADQAKAAEQAGHSEADKHLDAISAILNASKTGALTKAETTELKKHVAELRQLLQQK